MYGLAGAKHLIVGHSYVKNWKGEENGVKFGNGLDYAVYSSPGASVDKLLRLLDRLLAGLPNEDRRTCIVQVVLTSTSNLDLISCSRTRQTDFVGMIVDEYAL